ncbi:putative alpha-mannosidase [Tetragenococcus halophilus subsp. halophilus]|uniref:glycoside hydrolase family 38 N-terminal domain-containing protein n=1 Tax=Tetragenococcus halophilus TaxID=51669 RepID=UPI000CB30D9E|nr:glycoside hydrolase family 38 C-terminal domain-containing protein [Tetragenococcus halophilus]GBD79606.1 putative alpha-mannosidase [Tetragenococcus halophilus subsp. halophilus]GBD81818.1 putative alpha-mannosidase [Tetragenococcus halophilus subsp. halophilus]
MVKKVHVIHHTHWDLEWYFTSNESFIQLIYHLDEVMDALEQNKIDYYLLDGQMSLLDDYLTSFPEQKKRLQTLVESGKLRIGPWYTQTDELIISGESIIRNLNAGMSLANQLGGYMNVGYLPDSFGQGKDMPKIYNGLGIKNAVFWRGVSEDVTVDREFNWKSEDGSSVIVSNIKDGYFAGLGLIYDEDYQGQMDIVGNGATSDELLLPVGGDQRYVDRNLKERVAVYNKQLQDYHLEESTYEDFFHELSTENLSEVQGEFISSSVSKIHRSIYSSRYDQKYLNDKIERRMTYQVEPLMAMADQLGITYKQGILDKIWRLLNRNQAHDSAGGCNSDKTNQAILARYTQVDQLSYSIVDYLTRKISESRHKVQENDLTIFNPLPWKVKKVIKVDVSTDFSTITVTKDGKDIPFEYINTEKEYNGSIKRTSAEMDENKFYFIHTIALEVEIPSLDFTTYQVEKGVIKDKLENKELKIENDGYFIEFKQNTLNLYDKKHKKTYHRFIQIEDSGDEGDTYDYSPAYENDTYLFDFENAVVKTSGESLLQTMTIEGTWQIARNLNSRGKKIRDQEISYQLTLSLSSKSTHIDCHLTIDNSAYDHRMRVLVQTPLENSFSYADTPFGVAKRPVEDPHLKDWQEMGWKEEPTAIFPMIHYVNTHNEKQSLTLFSKGIKEYQIVGDKFDKIALTLFRSVGYLGRPDLLRRPGKASGNEFKYIATPDSQLQQKLTFKFSIQIEDHFSAAKLSQDYLDYALMLPYYQIQELNLFTTTLKYFVSNPLEEKIDYRSPFTLKTDTLVYSSFRKSMKNNGYELRLYNPDMQYSVEGGSITFSDTKIIEYVDLKGDVLSKQDKNDIVDLGIFKPGEIRTIRIV